MMISNIDQASTTRAQRKMTLLYALFGSLPSSAGRKLRQYLYRSVFGRMGSNVSIETQVLFMCPSTIELGSGTVIRRYASINCWQPNSKFILQEGASLDQGVHIQSLGGTIEIGEWSYLGPYVCMAGPGDIRIGKDCLIASGCGIYANNHAFDDPTKPINQQAVISHGITIGDDCWLGTGVKVLDGVTIGQGCVIGAGAVVTKDIPPYSVAVGVPAKVISKRGAQRQAHPVS